MMDFAHDPRMLGFMLLGGASQLYLLLVVAPVALWRRDILSSGQFSNAKYYWLMGWAPASYAALALTLDTRYFFLFFVAGLAGVVGELIVALAWRQFFHQPIWTYSYRSLLGGHTSAINFFPWAVGALIFCEFSRVLGLPPASVGEFTEVVLLCMLALGLAWLAVWRPGRAHRHTSGQVTRRAFALFCAPILAVVVVLFAVGRAELVLLMAAFAVVGAFTEYSYGVGMSVLFEHQLWTYNHWQLHGGHSSWVTLPLWALGGLYFYLIAAVLGL